jgi:hypothetical protein
MLRWPSPLSASAVWLWRDHSMTMDSVTVFAMPQYMPPSFWAAGTLAIDLKDRTYYPVAVQRLRSGQV